MGVLRSFGIELNDGVEVSDVTSQVGGERELLERFSGWKHPAASAYANVLIELGSRHRRTSLSHDVVNYDFEIDGDWGEYANYLREFVRLARAEAEDVTVSERPERNGRPRSVSVTFEVKGGRHDWLLPQASVNDSPDFIPRLSALLRLLDPSRVLVGVGDSFVLLSPERVALFREATGLGLWIARPYESAA